MGSKQDRRGKRKAKEAAKDRERERQPFTNALNKAIRKAQIEHPSLVAVVQYDHAQDRPDPDDDFLIKEHELDKYTRHLFTTSDEGGHRSGGKGLGGFTMMFTDSQGVKKTAIFIRKPKITNAADYVSCSNTAVLYHELGHVDDYEKGLFLIVGQILDVTKAERYANQYACDNLKRDEHRLALAFWLAALEYCSAVCGVPNVEAAAKIVIESPQYPGYLAFVGGHSTVENMKSTFSSDDPISVVS